MCSDLRFGCIQVLFSVVRSACRADAALHSVDAFYSLDVRFSAKWSYVCEHDSLCSCQPECSIRQSVGLLSIFRTIRCQFESSTHTLTFSLALHVLRQRMLVNLIQAQICDQAQLLWSVRPFI